MYHLFLPVSPVLARGGGGGSGGGSGGGGGGSLIVAIGYVPMHFLGAKVHNKLSGLLSNLIVWPIALIYTFILFHFGGLGVLAGICALIGAGAGLYGWFDAVLKRGKAAQKKLNAAASMDPTWNQETILARVQEVFMRYQADWSANNAANMQFYMTDWYFYHARLMVLALQQQKRQNIVGDPRVIRMIITDIQDSVNNAIDSFTVYINAAADDQLIDTQEQKLLFRDKRPFEEYWHFQRVNNQWMLAGIDQATANVYSKSEELKLWAAQHQYCYSLDWGWLLLPKRGQLFGKGKFGTSDINNHIVGVYNNTLVQFYNYNPAPNQGTKVLNYLIAQVAVPKTYGNIVVRKKRLFGRMKGMTRMQMEWRDFNVKYEVWASDLERATSFELLNPAFMVKLQELPFEVNIEVVDNIVYLYSMKVPASSKNYDVMLDILFKAFKEMRM